MNANHLLFLLSARREGTWQQFKSAVEQLHLSQKDDGVEEPGNGGLPLYQQFRFSLQQLGHVEFSGEENRWRVAPPVIALRASDDGWYGLLCGARLPALIDRLRQAGEGCQMLVSAQDGAPDVIELRASSRAQLEKAASHAGIAVQMEACRAILAATPAVDDPDLRWPIELPAGNGWTVSRFSASQLRWVDSSRGDAANVRFGLFRFQYFHQQQHLVVFNDRVFSMNGQAAKFLLLRRMRRRRRVIRYDQRSNTLVMPAICRPPPMVDRALVLCTGALPQFDKASRSLAYRGIPTDVAVCAARLMRQEIR